MLNWPQLQDSLIQVITRQREDDNVVKQVRPAGTLTAIGALEVYQVAVVARLTDALEETYEATAWVLGDEYYDVAESFISQYPSKSPNLSDFGEKLSQFIEAIPQAKRYPFLPELAAFEWQFKNVFHTKDSKPFDQKSLQEAMLHGDIKVSLAPCVRVLKYSYPVYEVWRRRKEGPFEEMFGKRQLAESQFLLMYKKLHSIYIRELDEKEFAYLNLLRKGCALEEAVEIAGLNGFQWTSEELGAFFGQLLPLNIFADVQPA